MVVRKIIEIDEEKCNGCGLCVPNCAEGAIQIVNGKAKLISDIYCDGLGACIGHCPEGALKIIEREAEEFDEEAVEELLKSQGKSLKHQPVEDEHYNVHNHSHAGGGCPGSRAMELKKKSASTGTVSSEDIEIKIRSQLRGWPVQLALTPITAPYFQKAHLLITADCVPFAYPNYHLDLLKGKIPVVGCPKLDDIEFYTEKLTQILKANLIQSVTVAFMEVPCCQGIVMAARRAVAKANKDIPLEEIEISINGEKL